MSQQARRYNVVALALVLCAWLVTAATHLHVQDQATGATEAAHCAHCLALSAGAAPPPTHNLPTIIVTPTVVVPFGHATPPSEPPRSSYLSRGPPAI